jgi:hypothetical protein
VAFPSINVSTTTRRTGLELIQAAMGEIGMPRPASIEDGNDETAIQLLYQFNELGENLSRFPFFSELSQTWSITTTTATAYDLPADWACPLSGTNWDRSGRWPLLGPKTPAEWQYLQSGFGVAAPQYRFRYYGGQYHLFPAPVAGLTIVQEYLSTHWVLGIGATPGLADTAKIRVTLNTDYCILDERMMIEGLKLAFLESKGLDSSIQSRKWERMMEAAWANSKGAPSLSLAPIPANIFITEWNAPDTGYGQ